MFVVCRLLFALCCYLSNVGVCNWLLVVFVDCCVMLSVVGCALFVVRCLLVVG